VNIVIDSDSEADTIAAGARLGATLQPGDVVLVSGDLGAGKTVFVRGLAEGLGVDPGMVSSPTFTLVQEYRGRALTLFHADLYRVNPGEVDDVALDDLLEAGNAVLAVEWAERWSDAPAHSVRVHLTHGGELRRRIRVDRAPETAMRPDGRP
jgi:tRNA threonylcarbamoyladenosine biosynthesis protein TsaE